jgi:outer membrane lipopolysaccharide assembly protein LptE/RlpB
MGYNIRLLLIAFSIVMLQACGYYSFKGSLPSHYKAIAIPLFDDRSAYPEVREELTNGLIDAFIEDNTLQVLDESNSDIILIGTIVSIKQQEANVSTNEVTKSYKLVLNVKVRCEDLKTDKILLDKSVSQYAYFEADGGQEEREEALATATELMIEDIISATLGMW